MLLSFNIVITVEVVVVGVISVGVGVFECVVDYHVIIAVVVVFC